MFKKLLFSISTLLLLTKPGFTKYNETAVDFYNKANEHLQKDEIKEAEAFFLKAIKQDDKIVEAYYQLGNIYYIQNKKNSAKTYYLKAISLKPNHTNSNRYLGIIFLSQGKVDESIKYLKLAHENSPSSIDILIEYCTALFHKGNNTEVKKLLLEHASSENYAVNYLLYKVFSSENDLEKSLQNLEKAYLIIPKKTLLKELVDLYVLQKKYQNALQLLLKVEDKNDTQFEQIISLYLLLGKNKEARNFFNDISKNLQNSDLKHKLNGDIYFANDNKDMALEELLLVKNKLNYSDINLHIGSIYFEKNKLTEAKPYLLTYLNKNPSENSARKKLVSIFYFEKKYNRALELANTSLNYNKEDEEIFNQLGLIHMANNNLLPAKHYFEKSISLNSKNAMYYYNLGLVHYKLEKYSLSVVNFEKALSLDNKNFNFHSYLAIAYEKVKKYDLAISHLKKVLNAKPDEPSTIKNLGIIYYKQDNHKESLKYLNKFLSFTPGDIEALLLLKNIYTELRKFDKAEEHVRNALSYKGKTPDLLYELSLQLIYQNKLPEASETLKDLLKINPSHIEGNLAIANIYKNQSNNLTAINHFRKVTTSQNSNIEGRENLIFLYLAEDNIQNAQFHLKRLEMHSPESQIIPWAEGIIFYKNNEFTNAISSLNKTTFQPFITKIYIGKSYLALKNFKLALETFKKVRDLIENEDHELESLTALALYFTDQKKDAFILMNSLIKTYSTPFYEILYLASEIEFEKKNYLRSLTLANESLESKKNLNIPNISNTFDSFLDLLLGNLYFQIKEFKKSISYLKNLKGEILSQNFIKINHLLADSYYSLGDTKKALRSWEAILARAPNDPLSLFGISKIFSGQKKFDLAANFIEKALLGANELSLKEELTIELGNIYLKTSNLDKAIDAYRSAIGLNSNNIESYLKLAESLFHKEKYDESISEINKALQIKKEAIPLLYLKAKAYVKLKDFKNATEFFEQVIDLEPKNVNAYIAIIEMLITVQDIKLAKKYLEHTMKIIKEIDLSSEMKKEIEDLEVKIKKFL